MDRYDAKKRYSKQEIVDLYDYCRFRSESGRIFDTLEKDIVLLSIPQKRGEIVALDVGTGTGRFAILLAQYGLDVLAVDVSTPMLEKAKEKLTNLEPKENVILMNADIYHLPFKDATFDYVVCIRVLNQLGSKQYMNDALNELCRVCNNSGTILIDFVNSHSLAWFAKFSNSGLVSPSEMKKFLNDIHGINVKDIKGRLILSQTLLERVPKCLLNAVRRADLLLSNLLPKYATRVYFVLEKS